MLAGLAYVVRHNLNSADAAILATFVRYAQSLPPGSPRCVLAAADQRLLRVAEAEGLSAFNPERLADIDIPRFLTA